MAVTPGLTTLDPHWVLVATALGLAGSLRYAAATLTGAAQPNLVIRILWAAVPLIGFSAQLAGGMGLPAVLTLAFDMVCALVATTALVVWLGFDAALV